MTWIITKEEENESMSKESDRQLFYERLGSLYFIDDDHKRTFVALAKESKVEWDPEYMATYYLLMANMKVRLLALKYMGSFIDFVGMREDREFNYLTNVHQLIINVANVLYNQDGEADLLQIVCLDEELYQCVLSTFRIRRGRYPMGFLEPEFTDSTDTQEFKTKLKEKIRVVK